MKLINIFNKLMENFIHMFNNVNKTYVLQPKFKNVKIHQYDLNIKKLSTLNT